MKSILSVLFLCFIILANAQNLIKNGDLNGNVWQEEFRLSDSVAQGKLSQETEDLTWNKCLKLEIVKYSTDQENKRSINVGIDIGGDKKQKGFICKPDNSYQFSIEVKGQAQRAMLNYKEYDKDGKLLGKKRTSIHLIAVQKDWTVYKGTFKTRPETHRAALNIQFWGNEKRNDLKENIGDYILIDNVLVEEEAPGIIKTGGQLSELTSKKQCFYLVDTKENWYEVSIANDFSTLKTGTKIPIQTTFQIRRDNDALYLKIKAFEPELGKIKALASVDGDNSIWQDDTLEIFFESVSKDRRLSHFVINPRGIRWMGYGTPAAVNNFTAWSVQCKQEKDGWISELKIPFTTLGYEKPPVSGDHIKFNICRRRMVENKELSSWSFLRESFHELENFGILFFQSIKPYAEEIIAMAQDEKDHPQVAELLKSIDYVRAEDTFSKLQILEKLVNEFKLSRRKYILAQISPTTDTAIPFMPKELNHETKKLKIRAAIGEMAPLVMALANMTDIPEEYRVRISRGWENPKPRTEQWYAMPGLANIHGEVFPGDRIDIRRGIAFRDSEAPIHGRRYDILAKLNEAATLPVSPKESGLLWVTFNCRNAKPGIYRGFLDVIPFNESCKSIKRDLANGGYIVDSVAGRYEIELEILPFALPEEPMPFYGYRAVYSQQDFDFIRDYDGIIFMITPWFFTFTFNPDGTVKEYTTREYLEPLLKSTIQFIRARKIPNNPVIKIGYAAYSVFKRVIVPKDMIPGSEEFWNAWRNWCKGVAKIMHEHGISPEEYSLKVMDEANYGNVDITKSGWDNKKMTEAEVVKAYEEAAEAVPGIRLMISASSNQRLSDDGFKRLAQVITDWIFSAYRTNDPAYAARMNYFKSLPNKNCGIYLCGTSQRQDLYRYYRIHSWNALAHDCTSVGLFQMYEQILEHSFYQLPFGSLAYNNMPDKKLIPSVRLESFRIGQTDIKYMKLLESLAQGNSPTAQEAREFLKTAPREVYIVYPHDNSKADEMRNKAIEYILKLNKSQ